MRQDDLRLSVGEFVPRTYRADGREVSCQVGSNRPQESSPDPVESAVRAGERR